MRTIIRSFLALTLAASMAVIYFRCVYSSRRGSEPSTGVPRSHEQSLPPPRSIGARAETAFSGALLKATPEPEWHKRLREINLEQDSDLLEDVALTVTDEELRDALDQLAAGSTETGMLLGRLLVRRWVTTAPAEAAEWVARLPDGNFGHMAFREIMIPWAEKDLAGAVAWLKQLPENGNKTAALFSLASEAATRKEAATAIPLIADFPPGPERDELLNYSLRQWATTDYDGALAWARQVSDAALREEILGNLAIDVGVQDPFRAAELAATMLPAGEIRDKVVVSIVRFWSPSAPAEAAAWVERFPDGNLRIAAIENLIDVWAKEDSPSAGLWLSRLPGGGSRDAALSVYAPLVAATSPGDALLWAGEIQDDALRAKTRERLRND